MLCNSHGYGPRRSRPAACPPQEPTAAQGAQAVRHPAPSPSPIHAPARLSMETCLRDATPRWTTHSGTHHFHFPHPARRRHSTLRTSTSLPPGDLFAREQHRRISACVLFLAMRWQNRPPQIGERGRLDAVFPPPIVFWTLLAVSSTNPLPDPPSL